MPAAPAGAPRHEDSAAADRIVDMAGMDSFPASDPPAWWAGQEQPPDPGHAEDAPGR